MWAEEGNGNMENCFKSKEDKNLENKKHDFEEIQNLAVAGNAFVEKL